MGSGQKAMYEEAQEEAYKDNLRRLEAHGYKAILEKLEIIEDELRGLHRDSLSLPRHSWRRLDTIEGAVKDILRKEPRA